MLAILIALGLVGCSSHRATVRYSQGGYFLIGDETCVTAYHLTPARVMCQDEEGHATGYRDAMSEYEITLYAMQQAQARRQYQQSMQQLQQSNRELRETTQRIMQQNAQRLNSMQQPEVYDWQQPRRRVEPPAPDWTERTHTPAPPTPATLVDKRWENGALWCIYSNDRVRRADSTICPYFF